MASSSSRRVVVRLTATSDGDPTHAPSDPERKEVDPPTIYLEKVADQWMKNRGQFRKNESYILEHLPAGYRLFAKKRPGSSSHVDKWLYGHPSGHTFDSPNRFYPHFEYIMNNGGSSIGCSCSVCVKGGVLPNSRSSSRPVSSASRKSSISAPASKPISAPASKPPAPVSAAPLPKGRPKMVPPGLDTSRIDEEGTPDVWRNLIDKLKRHSQLDEIVEEPMSMDWRAEKPLLSNLRRLENQPQWIPRVGDIVLYLRNSVVDATNPTMASSPPRWAAGLVTQGPGLGEVYSDDKDDRDAKDDRNGKNNRGAKGDSITISGVRVEPIPNPNDGNKSISKRYKYVPVHHTRPFFLWEKLVPRAPEDEDDELSQDIKNALTCMSTMSLVGKHRFQGQWPTASIWCHGIYIGAEFIVVGDTVRMSPKAGHLKAGSTECEDIMVVKSIRLKLSNLDRASTNDYDNGPPYTSEAWFFGRAYTMDDSRLNKLYLDHKNAVTPKAAGEYASAWHPLHPSNKEMAVPFSRIIGRLHDRDAYNDSTIASLDEGREAILNGRLYSRDHDNRLLKSPGSTWYWGDSRSQALDLETVNGLEVGTHDAERYVTLRYLCPCFPILRYA